jgi:choline dehydrogenase-like flavoprotein
MHSRAKMLGGCSSHNGGISFPPFDYDMEQWQRLGAEGWTHAEMMRLYKKLRNNIVPVDHRHRSSIVEDWVKTCANLFRIPISDDFNKEIAEKGHLQQSIGYLNVSYTPDDNHRSSASVAYIHPILSGKEFRPNLKILLRSWVAQILFKDSTAVGVKVTTNSDQDYVVSANTEVILCAGAFDTPRLMLLSGLGPSAELTSLGLPVVKDLPGVGENLQDHAETLCMWEIKEKVPEHQVVMGSEAAMVLRREEPNARGTDGAIMDTMFHIFTVPFDFYTKPMGYETPKHAFCIIPFTARPRSVGRLYLTSADPKTKPALDQRYFSDAEGYDKATNLFMLKQARKIAQAEPFKNYITREIAPGPNVRTDDQLCEYGRKVSNTVYHPCGTVKMGNISSDPLAVVDPALRVRGIARLRVADASVFPCMTSINPMVTVLCIGERAAELIIADASKTRSMI